MTVFLDTVRKMELGLSFDDPNITPEDVILYRRAVWEDSNDRIRAILSQLHGTEVQYLERSRILDSDPITQAIETYVTSVGYWGPGAAYQGAESLAFKIPKDTDPDLYLIDKLETYVLSPHRADIMRVMSLSVYEAEQEGIHGDDFYSRVDLRFPTVWLSTYQDIDELTLQCRHAVSPQMDDGSSSEPKMYILINTDLGMGKGKMVGQGGHVIRRLTTRSNHLCFDEHQLWDSWIDQGETKIVLRATTSQLESFIENYENSCVFVRDAGRTQIPAGSLTAVGFFPMLSKDGEVMFKDYKLL